MKSPNPWFTAENKGKQGFFVKNTGVFKNVVLYYDNDCNCIS